MQADEPDTGMRHDDTLPSVETTMRSTPPNLPVYILRLGGAEQHDRFHGQGGP